jgi:hypothetical protein
MDEPKLKALVLYYTVLVVEKLQYTGWGRTTFVTVILPHAISGAMFEIHFVAV